MPFQNVKTLSLEPVPTQQIRQGRFVNFSGATGQIIEAPNNSDAIGVSLEASPDSDTAGVDIQEASAAISVATGEGSIVEVEAGSGAIAVGANISTNATGLATTAASNNPILARALTGKADSVTGAFITVMLSKAARVV